jgi:hypothetical protein
MKTRKHDIFNKLIKEKGYNSYLEIGVDMAGCFNKVNCAYKIGVDPNSKFATHQIPSNHFFRLNEDKFDLIFIDGLHTAEQVEEDIINTWEVLNKGGLIVVHDINPETEEAQSETRISTPWRGTVWRAWVGLMKTYPKLTAFSTDDDSGLGFLYKTRHKIESGFIDTETTFEEFAQNRNDLLRCDSF